MTIIHRPTPHGDKLVALTGNGKLPVADRERVERALERYKAWRNELATADGEPEEVLAARVEALNAYKNYIDLELIFDADDDFLYRQNGQLKLSNSILEEFLPFLFDQKIVPGLSRVKSLICGPKSSFAGMSFDAPYIALGGGGVQIKLKDQDFAVCKPYLFTISDPSSNDRYQGEVVVSYFAAEIKTNLDKTMFQEASQTASELKRAVPGAKYILLCEYLDMTPISTRLTAIDEVVVLRKAKRLPSNVRTHFANAQGRRSARGSLADFLKASPLSLDCFLRVVEHLRECFPIEDVSERSVLDRGYF